MIFLFINYLLYFSWAIILASNPISLINLYKKMSIDELIINRIQTTMYVWGLSNNLNNNYDKSEKMHLKDVKRLLIYGVNFVLFYSYFFYEYIEITKVIF